MNGRHSIHLLLLVAMLFSQIATNAHMITHMEPAVAIDHQFSFSEAHNHYHNNSTLSHTTSDNTKSDCSIYHAYAGVNGLAPASCNYGAVRSTSILAKIDLRTHITRLTLFDYPIRGPPLNS